MTAFEKTLIFVVVATFVGAILYQSYKRIKNRGGMRMNIEQERKNKNGNEHTSNNVNNDQTSKTICATQSPLIYLNLFYFLIGFAISFVWKFLAVAKYVSDRYTTWSEAYQVVSEKNGGGTAFLVIIFALWGILRFLLVSQPYVEVSTNALVYKQYKNTAEQITIPLESISYIRKVGLTKLQIMICNSDEDPVAYFGNMVNQNNIIGSKVITIKDLKHRDQVYRYLCQALNESPEYSDVLVLPERYIYVRSDKILPESVQQVLADYCWDLNGRYPVFHFTSAMRLIYYIFMFTAWVFVGIFCSLYPTMLCVFLPVIALYIFRHILRKKQFNRLKAQYLKMSVQYIREFEKRTLCIDLYSECKAHGIETLNTKADRDRMKMIAKQMEISGYSWDELCQIFHDGKAIVDPRDKENADRERHDHLSAIREEEKAVQKQACAFASYEGNQKPIQMYTAELNMYIAKIRELNGNNKEFDRKLESVYQSSKQHEPSWAIHGGIANGIAGPAAGIATAVDVQRRSAEIREQNQNLLNSMAALSADMLIATSKKVSQYEEKVEQLNRKIQDVSLLLSEKLVADQLLALLSPEVTSMEITETSAIKLKIKTQNTSGKVTIYDNLSAYVDGSIKAEIFEGNSRLGSVVFTLPVTGSRQNAEMVSYWCGAFDKKIDENAIRVVFKPNKLFALELK